MRVAALLAAFVQIAVALAPLLEARDSRNTRAHVEESTAGCRYVHNEEACAACAATHLLGRVERPSSREVPVEPALCATTDAPPPRFHAGYYSLPPSRAPPPLD